MRIMIDIVEGAYIACKAVKDVEDDGRNPLLSYLINSVANSTPLPENPTNGDMIKSVFPDIALYEKNHDAIEISFNGVWWDAPYERGE